MDDKTVRPETPPRKHKRGRRKKLQKKYQENHQEQMLLQLERRFQGQASHSSPTTIEEIPLPSEINTPFGNPPRLVEEDYEIDFLKDPKVISTHSGETKRSDRIVRKAWEAETYLLDLANSTASNVLEDFKKRILEVSASKRSRQTDVPLLEHSLHLLAGENLKFPKKVSEDPENSESGASDKSQSDSEGILEDSPVESESEESTRKMRMQQKRERRQENFDARKRQSDLNQLEIERKRNHPNRVHPEVPYNEKGLGNDGPECRCPLEIRKKGLRHGYYCGEDKIVDCSRTEGSNLYYYKLEVTPSPNEDQQCITQMMISGEEFIFDGFTLVTHSPLPDCMARRPICKYSLEYEFQLIEEVIPEGCFQADESDILFEYIFHEVFEMMDFNLRPSHLSENSTSCPMIHIMPRFVFWKEDIWYLWSTKTVLAYFIAKGSSDMLDQDYIKRLCGLDDDAFNRKVGKIKQTIVLNAEFKPAALRADYFERDVNSTELYFNHSSLRPQCAFSGPTKLAQRLGRKLRNLNFAKDKLEKKEFDAEYEEISAQLHVAKEEKWNSRYLQLRQNMNGYTDTGLKPDVVAHIAMVILASHHIRYNFGITEFEKVIDYQFNDRTVIELALTHSSFKSHYGTPIDHVRNIINNCGYRRKYTGDTGEEKNRDKKKGIANLFNIINGLADVSPILHNERLEYLGDAVVELVVSHHLFFMLPHHSEGGLATYRTSLVQNRNLAKLALNCKLDELLQYAHGAELCNLKEWKHALANAFEATFAAIYLDGGIAQCDRIFSKAMYGADPDLKKVWDHVNEHELKREDPYGDRELSQITPTLASFHKLEEMLGIQFNNIRLLAKAFTRRIIPHNDLTKGHNQRLEWLGDSVLQLVISDYLFRNFPLHHEGHMSLLRTSLVSNQTQSYICDDLGFQEFVLKPPQRTSELKLKDKADLVEAFIGALYVDRGIEHCRGFIRIVFCPRLQHFINHEKWNDAKSHLQQFCLAMRDSQSYGPSMPEYRTLGIEGPTNRRVYKVAVYFREKRLAYAEASTIHKAELRAAELALADLESSYFSRMKRRGTNFSRNEDTTNIMFNM